MKRLVFWPTGTPGRHRAGHVQPATTTPAPATVAVAPATVAIRRQPLVYRIETRRPWLVDPEATRPIRGSR